MTLDPMPDAATLLRIKADREGRASAILRQPISRLEVAMAQTNQVLAAMPWGAVTLRLPWSCLVSDNEKHVAFLRAGKPAMKIRREYADAKERIAALARDTMGTQPAYDCPLTFTARVWYPNNHPRDLTNWCKLVHDALSGVVYADDRWLRDVRWLHAGVDVDAPHATITVSPLSEVP